MKRIFTASVVALVAGLSMIAAYVYASSSLVSEPARSTPAAIVAAADCDDPCCPYCPPCDVCPLCPAAEAAVKAPSCDIGADCCPVTAPAR